MKWVLAFTFLGICTLPPWAAAATQSATNSPKKQSSRTRGRTVKRRRAARKARATYQLHPDPERYQEIQKALAERGYFKGEVNGQWGDDSVEALKRFQADQKLPDDGKINALSLIGLGLGPKHSGSAGAPASAPSAGEPPH
jgi:peptidoglycan hydrolase-like protein with peptidoglycan-binding domain